MNLVWSSHYQSSSILYGEVQIVKNAAEDNTARIARLRESEIMSNSEIKLSNEQQAALDLMLAGKNVFLTGEAGTGKSTILHKFKKTGRNQRVVGIFEIVNYIK